MSTASHALSLFQPVQRKLRSLRWLVRLYVFLDGLLAVVLLLSLAFWAGLALDWTVEPTPFWRGLLGLVLAGATAYVTRRYWWGPLRVRLPSSSLALLLERNFPALNQSLITTVEAAERQGTLPEGNRDLLEHTCRQAAATLEQVPLRQVFRLRPLLRKLALALALGTSLVAFAKLQPAAFGFWLQRMQLSEQLWPRQVALRVVGFGPLEGTASQGVNVARDDDFELTVLASLRDGHTAPEQVEIRYRRADGRRGRDVMTQIGLALPGRDAAQRYRYQFKKVAADLEFDLVGGDDRLRGLRLHVVERPQVVQMELACQFPEYLERAAQTLPVTRRVELPEGTTAECLLESNKPLTSVRVVDPSQQTDLAAKLDQDNPHLVRFPVAVAQADQVVLITLLDQQGIENREPYRVVFSPQVDLPPEVSVELRGIGTAVTPQATIPWVGQVTDAVGLESVWFEAQVNASLPVQRPVEGLRPGTRQLQQLGRFDLALVDPQLPELVAGQQLILSVKARDAYDLSEQPHVGSSQRFLLDVVTHSELRALLEKKELTLRQRFEAIFEKMEGTQSLFAKLGSEPTSAHSPAELDSERNRLRIRGAHQNVIQLAYETLGVAAGFEAIAEELVNNRVDSEELIERLLGGIAEPLRELGQTLLPQLQVELEQLMALDDEPSEAALAQLEARGEEVLEAMQRVLDRMLELESYNELVELLRGIVTDQQKVQQQTKQQRREKLRSLLEE